MEHEDDGKVRGAINPTLRRLHRPDLIQAEPRRTSFQALGSVDDHHRPPHPGDADRDFGAFGNTERPLSGFHTVRIVLGHHLGGDIPRAGTAPRTACSRSAGYLPVVPASVARAGV